MTKQIYIPTEEELIELGFSYSMSCDCKAKEVKSGIFITYDCGFGIDIDSIFGEPYGGYTEVYPRSKQGLIDFISNFSYKWLIKYSTIYFLKCGASMTKNILLHCGTLIEKKKNALGVAKYFLKNNYE